MSDQHPPADMPEDHPQDAQEPEGGEGRDWQADEQTAPPPQWYYALGGQSYGGVTESHLKALAAQGVFGMHDYVYAPFLDDWVRADSVYGLFDEGAADAPAAEGADAERVPMPAPGSPEALTYQTQYAGFWIRAGAVIIDWLVLWIPNCLISSVLSISVALFMKSFADMGRSLEPVTLFVPWFLMYGVQYGAQITVAWLYFGLMESSRWQATLGKRAVSIVVTDLEGRRLSFGHASGRYFSSIVSTLTLGVGYIMGAFTQRRQTLHDLMARTVVVYGRQRQSGPPK